MVIWDVIQHLCLPLTLVFMAGAKRGRGEWEKSTIIPFLFAFMPHNPYPFQRLLHRLPPTRHVVWHFIFSQVILILSVSVWKTVTVEVWYLLKMTPLKNHLAPLGMFIWKKRSQNWNWNSEDFKMWVKIYHPILPYYPGKTAIFPCSSSLGMFWQERHLHLSDGNFILMT